MNVTNGRRGWARLIACVGSHKRLALVGVWLVLQSLDVATTAFGLRNGLREGNGFAAMIIERNGELAVYGFKALATLAILSTLLLLQRRYARLWLGLRIVSAYMFVVVLFNLLNIAFQA